MVTQNLSGSRDVKHITGTSMTIRDAFLFKKQKLCNFKINKVYLSMLNDLLPDCQILTHFTNYNPLLDSNFSWEFKIELAIYTLFQTF